MEQTCDLFSQADPVPITQHLDVILEGLPQEYSPVISVVESKFDTIDIDEVESLLIAHETRLDKFKKKTIDDVASLNLTHTPAASGSQTPTDSSMSSSSVNNTVGPDSSSFTPNFGSFRGRGGRNGRGCGRGGRYPNVQCQACFKFGHLASTCWHRFNQQFQALVPANFQGFVQASGTSHPGMTGYGNNFSGFNAPASGYGVNFAGFNPLQNWTDPSLPQRQPSIQFNQPSAMLANAPSTSGSSTASTPWCLISCNRRCKEHPGTLPF